MKLSETMVGSYNYNVLRNLLAQGRVVQLGRGAEIGVLYADTSCHLLAEFPNLTLFCVDPWVAYDEFEPDRTLDKMREYEAIARNKLRVFGDRAQIIKDFSVSAAGSVPDASLDFVFIDALHTYEAVSEDIAAWYSKVRNGGLLSGHDYRWEGVQRAVDEFAQSSGLPGFCTPPSSDVWFFVK